MAEVSCSACSCRKSVLAFSAKPITVAKLVTPSCTIENRKKLSLARTSISEGQNSHTRRSCELADSQVFGQ